MKSRISILPDFFLDVLVDPHSDYASFVDLLDNTYRRGGGNILGPTVAFAAGGNGGNVALTTSALDTETFFLGTTSDFGKYLMEFFYGKYGVNVVFSTAGILASSMILEFRKKDQKINVMSSFSGSVADFGPEKLTESQWSVLLESQAVAITNFQNAMLLQLADSIISKIEKDTIVSIDFSDLTPHKARI